MSKYQLMFSAAPNDTLKDPQFNLLMRIWQAGQALHNSKETKAELGKELGLEIREALVLDGAFLLVVGKDFENVYEIKSGGELETKRPVVMTNKPSKVRKPSQKQA